jgi:RimJ/RimL family protein N-acetyltransferase
MQLITERLILRDFVADDWPAVLKWQRDERYLRYYAWADRTEEDAREFVQMFVRWQEEEPRRKFQLAITLPDTGEVIGDAGLRRKDVAGDPGLRRHDISDFEGDIGYELAPQHWGKGYATEAARAMLDFGFRELGLHRISSWCIADNVASARVLERLGMKLEGRLRQNERFKGRWWDTLLYAILEDEWRAGYRPQP